jgi:hypothetical protein
MENIDDIIDTQPDVVTEHIGIELGNIVVEEETELSNKNESTLAHPPLKMQGCGTWCDECFNCCCMPIECIARSCHLCSDCCSEIPSKTKQLYFFILYLFTGELNSEAVGYKKYFNITSKKDDQVNVPEILITATSIVFELYKTMIGSFLTVFTAQRCGQQTCTIWENIVPKNDLELAGIVINFFMATSLLIEYIFEIMREAYLIKYLKYDKSLANNGEHIAELYENTDKTIFAKLIPLYVIYIRFSYVVLLIYFVNVILSAVIVAENYYDNTSIFSFVTNALFIIYKIYNVVEITSYRGDYFYSAYQRKNIHYNDVRPKYLLKNIQETHDASSLKYDDIVPETSVPENVIYNQVDDVVINENVMIARTPELGTSVGVRGFSGETTNEFRRMNDIEPTQEEEIPIKKRTIQDVFAYLFKSTKAIVPKPSNIPYIDIEELDELGLDDAERDEVLKELYHKKYIDKMVFLEAMMVRRSNTR